MKIPCNVFWFRRDLRLDDNNGLYHALNSGLPVLPIFIFDKTILSNIHNKNDLRVNFIHQSISNLNSELKTYKSGLLMLINTPESAWEEVFHRYDVKTIFTNEDYEPSAIARDVKIARLADSWGVKVKSYKDQCIFHKFDVVTDSGQPYSVFTPYKTRWLKNIRPIDLREHPSRPLLSKVLPIKNVEPPSLMELGFQKVEFGFGTGAIHPIVLSNYDKTRDFPALDSTSRIGHHLRFGTVSIRKYVQKAMELNQTWLSELIWREFFMQIPFHYPHVVDEPFRAKYKTLEWRNNVIEFELWKQGMTGYPIVDAGMRELNTTGFMHNRVRMITASFLVKHLLVDWRLGEKYFAEKLLDYELSSNNGNWQWVAGTGCDAAPYFRIFNPDTQTKKFDSAHEYIDKWAPEYKTDTSPDRIVDHKLAYNRALSTYKKALGTLNTHGPGRDS
jgi:deoxyribodipyrimidine photo-lyase